MSDVPEHIAFIMDGNRRWARQQGLPQMEGHRKGLERTQEMVEACHKKGIKICTLWCFSTENWKRDQQEVSYLMRLFEDYIQDHLEDLNKKNVQIRHLGRKDRLPERVRELFIEAEELTESNSGPILQLAIDYGGRDEILRAVEKACQTGKTHWTEEDFSVLLDTAGAKDPDLIIRSSGEQRLSGFLLWQASYSELYFTDTCFPDFDEQELEKALQEYRRRNRTLGG